MPTQALQIRIKTTDKELLNDLRAEKIDGLRLMTHSSAVCDSIDWIPAVGATLDFVVEVAKGVEPSLLAAWLYDRFKNKPPEKVVVNNVATEPMQISIVINNTVYGTQVNKIDTK